MPHAFILGGNGQIGLATASRMLEAGWSVTLAHRARRGVSLDPMPGGADVVSVDREERGALARALGSGADVLIDVVAYGPEHARQLLAVQGAVGALVVVSSASVYRDEKGRTLDEAVDAGFPELPVPISERQPTVEPGPENYSTRKIELECTLLDEAVVPVTVLRPAAISGVGSTHAREWWFVKRVLDRRPVIPIAYRGQSVFHTTSAANIGVLILRAATLSGKRVLNIADPAALPVSDIATCILTRLDYSGRLVKLPDEANYPPRLGWTPWSVQRPFVLDTAAAIALGYRPAATYPETAAHVCEWLVGATAARDWRELFPTLATYPQDLFDYQREDAAL
jgi:nucleoside-diphosphate-sugar epimerase